MGRKQQSAGSAFEDMVLLHIHMMHPRPYYFKTYPELIWPGGVPVVVRKAQPDLVMFWEGSAFLFDCKSTGNKGKLKARKDAIHQFDAMRFADRAGAICFYLVEWREADTIEIFRIRYFTDWPYWCIQGEGDAFIRSGDMVGELLDQWRDNGYSRD